MQQQRRHAVDLISPSGGPPQPPLQPQARKEKEKRQPCQDCRQLQDILESARQVRAIAGRVGGEGGAFPALRRSGEAAKARHSGKPRVAFPTIRRLLIHMSCAMNLRNIKCNGIHVM